MVQMGNRLLIIGATGFIGRFVTESSLATGHTTYVLVRSGPVSPSKAKTIRGLQDKGAIILHGSLHDRPVMERILREVQIDVVISAVGGSSILEQLALVDAIKAVGTVKEATSINPVWDELQENLLCGHLHPHQFALDGKGTSWITRFLPSEFGHDVDRADPVEPGLTMYNEKRRVRRYVEAAGIPYTHICCNSIAAWPYHDNTHPADVLPPLDRFHIYGDGSIKAYFVAGTDIGKFTMKAIDDSRTLNKRVHFRPSCNFLNINELASLWEKKLGKTLPRVTVTEDDLITAAEENCIPQSIVASFTHDIFIKGCQVNFSLDGPNDIEVSSLYPDIPFRTVDECFNDYIGELQEEPAKEKNTPNSMVEMLAITATCG